MSLAAWEFQAETRVCGWTCQEDERYWRQRKVADADAAAPLRRLQGRRARVRRPDARGEPAVYQPLHDLFFKAAGQAGIPENDNFNDWGHSQVGSRRAQHSLKYISVLHTTIACHSRRIRGVLASQSE